jgi:hypothetical protein
MLTIPTVVARFRPQNKLELANGGEPIVAFQSEDTCSIQVRHHPQIMVFGTESMC